MVETLGEAPMYERMAGCGGETLQVRRVRAWVSGWRGPLIGRRNPLTGDGGGNFKRPLYLLQGCRYRGQGDKDVGDPMSVAPHAAPHPPVDGHTLRTTNLVAAVAAAGGESRGGRPTCVQVRYLVRGPLPQLLSHVACTNGKYEATQYTAGLALREGGAAG